MKLSNVFLLFFFSCAILFVGAVNDISAEEDHDTNGDGPYTAEAHAYRINRLNVSLSARASSTVWGKNGGFYLYLYRDLPNTAPQWDTVIDHKNHIMTHGGSIDGHFYATLPGNLPLEDYACRAYSISSGFATDGRFCQAIADAEVGSMPPPIPIPTPDPQPQLGISL